MRFSDSVSPASTVGIWLVIAAIVHSVLHPMATEMFKSIRDNQSQSGSNDAYSEALKPI